MALKIRCAFCDELMQYREDADNYTCVCGTVTRLPEGKAESDPYQGWGACYSADLKRRRPDANTGSRGRKRKPPAKPPARFNPNYYGV